MNSEQDSKKGFRVFLKNERRLFRIWMRGFYRYNPDYFFNGNEDANNTNLVKDFILAHAFRVISYPVSNGCATHQQKNIITDIYKTFADNLKSWVIDPKTVAGRSVNTYQVYKLQMRRFILRFVKFYKSAKISRDLKTFFLVDSDEKLYQDFINLLDCIIKNPNLQK